MSISSSLWHWFTIKFFCFFFTPAGDHADVLYTLVLTAKCLGQNGGDSRRPLSILTSCLCSTNLSFLLRQHRTICHAELCGENSVVKVCLHNQKCPKSGSVLRGGRARGRSAELHRSALVDNGMTRSWVLLWSFVMVASCLEFGEYGVK